MFIIDIDCIKDSLGVLGKPDRALRQNEKILDFTSDNKKCLDVFVGGAQNWKYPVGTFHAAEGGELC